MVDIADKYYKLVKSMEDMGLRWETYTARETKSQFFRKQYSVNS